MSASSRSAALSPVGNEFGHLALGDDGFFVSMHKFNRFLDRDDVTGKVGINVIDERGEGRAFAGAGGTRHENNAAPHMAERFDDFGHLQILEGLDFCGNDTENRAVSLGLLEVVAAETIFLIHLVGKIQITMFLVTLPALGRADFAQHVAHLLVGEWFLANGYDLSVAADFGRLALTKVEVGGAAIHENLKKLVDIRHIIGVR